MKKILNNRHFIFTILSLLIVFIFVNYSHIDVMISSKMYVAGEGFVYKHNNLIFMLNNINIPVIGCTLLWCIYQFFKHKLWNFNYKNLIFRKIAFILLVILIPQMFSKYLLKDNFFNRARPYMVQEFGGTQAFSPAFIPSDQCVEHCSFPSGHTTLAATTIVWFFILRGRKRKAQALIAAIVISSLVAFARIVSGMHFLSDTIVAMLLVFSIAYILAKLMKIDKEEY